MLQSREVIWLFGYTFCTVLLRYQMKTLCRNKKCIDKPTEIIQLVRYLKTIFNFL